jgi:hypothetical protein
VAAFIYNLAKRKLVTGDIDLNTDDMRVLLVKTSANTTTDTEDDTEFLSGFTTLGESNGSGYARQALSGEVVNDDSANNRAEFDASDVAFGALNGDTVGAALLYKHVGADSANMPVMYNDTGGFPVTLNGGTFTIQWNTEGIIQVS